MALFGKFEHTHRTQRLAAPFWHHLLVIPEATILLALLVIGWAFNFPVGISFIAMLVTGAFIVRLGLLSSAQRNLERGAYSRAERFTSAALRLNPWSVDALQMQAQSAAMQGDDDTAETVLRHAVTLAPRRHVIHTAFTATLIAQGQLSEAQEIMATQPSTDRAPQLIQQRAWYALHVEGNVEQAHQLLADAAPLTLPATDGLPLLVTLADAEIARHNPAAAQALIASLMAGLAECSTPQQAELHYHLGRLQQALGGDGYLHFRQSVDLDPQGRCAHTAWRSAISPAPARPERRRK